MLLSNLNTLRPRQNGRDFTDDIFKCIFLNENIHILIKISLKFVHKGPINNIPALVQIMAWHRPGDKPLSELMMVNLPSHIYASLGPNDLKTSSGSDTLTSCGSNKLFTKQNGDCRLCAECLVKYINNIRNSRLLYLWRMVVKHCYLDKRIIS